MRMMWERLLKIKQATRKNQHEELREKCSSLPSTCTAEVPWSKALNPRMHQCSDPVACDIVRMLVIICLHVCYCKKPTVKYLIATLAVILYATPTPRSFTLWMSTKNDDGGERERGELRDVGVLEWDGNPSLARWNVSPLREKTHWHKATTLPSSLRLNHRVTKHSTDDSPASQPAYSFTETRLRPGIHNNPPDCMWTALSTEQVHSSDHSEVVRAAYDHIILVFTSEEDEEAAALNSSPQHHHTPLTNVLILRVFHEEKL